MEGGKKYQSSGADIFVVQPFVVILSGACEGSSETI